MSDPAPPDGGDEPGGPDDRLGPLLHVLERLPFVGTVKRDAESLRALLYARRAPRIAVVGRPGAGKSTLGNALLGVRDLAPDEPPPEGPVGWRRLRGAAAAVDWLEVAVSRETTDPAQLEVLLRAALADRAPDCVLAVRSARDPEASFDEVLGTAVGVARLAHDAAGHRPSLLGVLTFAHELSDAAAGDAAFWDEAPNEREAARRALARALRARWSPPPRAVTFGLVDGQPAGLDEVADAVLQLLPDAARVEGARALPAARRARRQVANRIVQTCSTLAITVGLAPVPLSDAWIIGPLQVLMVSAIAHLGGNPWDRRTVSEWIGSLGVVGSAGIGLRWGFQQLVKVVPGAGTVLSGAIAGGGTAALGQSAIAYFLRDPGRLGPGETASDPGDGHAAGGSR